MCGEKPFLGPLRSPHRALQPPPRKGSKGVELLLASGRRGLQALPRARAAVGNGEAPNPRPRPPSGGRTQLTAAPPQAYPADTETPGQVLLSSHVSVASQSLNSTRQPSSVGGHPSPGLSCLKCGIQQRPETRSPEARRLPPMEAGVARPQIHASQSPHPAPLGTCTGAAASQPRLVGGQGSQRHRLETLRAPGMEETWPLVTG